MAKNVTGYQYAHKDWYSKTGAKKQRSNTTYHGTYRGKGWSASDVLAEALRVEGHCNHVKNPQPPNILHGSKDAVLRAIDAWEQSKQVTVKLKDGTTRTRGPRSDSPRMAGGVISFPRERMDEWPAYRDKAIAMLQEEHGERFRLAVEHAEDENHPHLHFYLVAEPGEDFGVVHAGYAASRKARGEDGNHVGKAFKDAMRAWQDKVHTKLSADFNLARLGPKRERTDRKTRLLQIEQEKIEATIAELEEREAKLSKREKAIQGKETGIILQTARVAKLLTDIDRRELLLEKNKNDLHAEAERRSARIEKLEQENAATRTELAAIFEKFDMVTKVAIAQHQPKILEVLKIDATVSSTLDSFGL